MTTTNTTTTTTTTAAPPPSLSPHSHSADMSPLTAVLSLLILVAVPALVYALFFAMNCPRISIGRDRRRGADSRAAAKEGKQPESELGGGFKYVPEAADGGETECPVCLSAFAEGDMVRQLGDCKHTFHLVCIDKWLCSHSNCPVCRASVPTLVPAGRPKRPAPAVEDDFRQGLPDAASLV